MTKEGTNEASESLRQQEQEDLNEFGVGCGIDQAKEIRH